jgi:hypothetical protein
MILKTFIMTKEYCMSIEDNIRKFGEEEAGPSPTVDEAPAPTPIEVPGWVAEWKQAADDINAALGPVVALGQFLFTPAIRIREGVSNPIQPPPAMIKAHVDMTLPAIGILQDVLERLRKQVEG